jgi:CBS domain-containing protein
VTRVRDAMVSEPLSLDASASAQQAGTRLADPGVRAVLVCAEGVLLGVVTRKTLVREIVAAGRDPATTLLGSIAEPPIFTLGADESLDAAFHELEERDLERVPVTENGRLVGILSRAVVQRRLAEDEPPADAAA